VKRTETSTLVLLGLRNLRHHLEVKRTSRVMSGQVLVLFAQLCGSNHRVFDVWTISVDPDDQHDLQKICRRLVDDTTNIRERPQRQQAGCRMIMFRVHER